MRIPALGLASLLLAGCGGAKDTPPEVLTAYLGRGSEGASTAPSEASPNGQGCAGEAGARTEVSQTRS